MKAHKFKKEYYQTKNMINKKRYLILTLTITMLFSTSRVAYTRPGAMIKIPTSNASIPTEIFTVGASTQIYKTSPLNKGTGIFFNTYLSPKFQIGLSSVAFPDTNKYIDGECDVDSPPEGCENITKFKSINEMGIHFQYEAYVKDDMSIGLGVQDILIKKGQNIDQGSISLYAVFASNRQIDDYRLGSFLGFGTGKIAYDAGQDTTNNGEGKQGIFLGFLLNTPYMKKQGGIDFMAEYDGGLNFGLKIPITRDYKLLMSITHFENFGEFGTQSAFPEAQALAIDAPSIVMGFNMSIPGGFEGTKPIFKKINLETDDIIQDMPTNELIEQLRDSLKYTKYQIENLTEHNAQMDQQLSKLIDSTRTMHLTKQIYKSNLNKTMRHLSRSLRYYYDADYMAALQEIEQAILVNPDIAAAYARRGAIYFKLGEQQKAIINWNLALKLDPEYEEVRKVLEAVHDKRLESATKLNNSEGL
tara:strand:- start:1126 stop:2544 length:1419 start_codon:yes stop_codon:yes gene_type:complete